MSPNTGGAAFPCSPDEINNLPSRGMTLRDYFAAKAPITLEDAMLSAGMGSDKTYCLQSINCHNGQLLNVHSKLCYQWADAMLKVR